MTAGEQLLVACLKKEDHKLISAIERKWLDGDEVKQYRFVMDYYREHGEMIGLKAFCDKFKLDPSAVDSRPVYYLNALKE